MNITLQQLLELFTRTYAILTQNQYSFVTNNKGGQLIVEIADRNTSGVVLVVEIIIGKDNSFYI